MKGAMHAIPGLRCNANALQQRPMCFAQLGCQDCYHVPRGMPCAHAGAQEGTLVQGKLLPQHLSSTGKTQCLQACPKPFQKTLLQPSTYMYETKAHSGFAAGAVWKLPELQGSSRKSRNFVLNPLSNMALQSLQAT